VLPRVTLGEDNMSSHCDKRQDSRIKIALPVILETVNGFLEGRVTNISAGGAFINCGNSLSIGERIYIAVACIPELNRHLAVKAELMWKNNCGSNSGGVSQGLGVKFTKIGETDQEVIFTLVSNACREGKNLL
jgi:Tfp pilus assembly protein PilZ